MPSFQSPEPNQRQAVAADRKTEIESARAVFVQRAVLFGDRRQKIRFIFAGAESGTVEKWNHLVENAEIAGDLDIMSGGKRQPYAVVGDSSAHPLARRRKPPMLNVARGELARGGAQQMLSRDGRASIPVSAITS